MIKGVKFISSILEEVAKEQGRSKKEVEEVWKLHKEYVKEQIDKEDVYIVAIPKIGNLFYNVFLYRNKVEKAKSDVYDKVKDKSITLKEDIIRHKKEEGSTKYLYPQGKRPNIYSLYKSIQWNVFNKRKRYTSFRDLIPFIENYSKKIYLKEDE